MPSAVSPESLSDAAILEELFGALLLSQEEHAGAVRIPEPATPATASSPAPSPTCGGPRDWCPHAPDGWRRVLSVDMGARHLAVAMLDAVASTRWTLRRWHVFDIAAACGQRDMDTGQVPVETLLELLGRFLATPAWRAFVGEPGTVDDIVIEQQPLTQASGRRFSSGKDKTIRMHSLACGLAVWLRAYFGGCDGQTQKTPTVHFVPAAQKISNLPRLLRDHGVPDAGAALREGAYSAVRVRRKDTDERIAVLLDHIQALADGSGRQQGGMSKSEKDKRYRMNKAAAVAGAMALLDHMQLRGWLRHLEEWKGKWDDYADALCQGLTELPRLLRDAPLYGNETASRRRKLATKRRKKAAAVTGTVQLKGRRKAAAATQSGDGKQPKKRKKAAANMEETRVVAAPAAAASKRRRVDMTSAEHREQHASTLVLPLWG